MQLVESDEFDTPSISHLRVSLCRYTVSKGYQMYDVQAGSGQQSHIIWPVGLLKESEIQGQGKWGGVLKSGVWHPSGC